jgi:branched-chain amino acid transport system ATP-binding protein
MSAESDDQELINAREEALAEAEHVAEATSRAQVAALAGLRHEPGIAKADPILAVDGVRRSFGGLRAVDVDHLEIQRGTITALIGPNGAGKTTLFNVLTGFDRAESGSWTFQGRPLARTPAHRVARAGMVRTFQLTKALMRLSCLENMMLAATGQRGERFWHSLVRPLWRAQEREVEQRALALLERFELLNWRDEFAGTLSGGQRKLLEMARALMVEPTLVMHDEPMAGVNPALTQSLLSHIIALRDGGMTVVFVEHDMDVVMGISDWVVCMAAGQVIAEGPPESMGTNDAVIDAYLGRAAHQAAGS